MSNQQTLSRDPEPPSPTHSLDEKLPLDNDSLECVHNDVRNLDVAVRMAAGHGGDSEVIDKEADRKLRWKIDLHLLPLLMFIYTVQFIDKNSLGASAILGIRTDNGLDANEYNNLASCFYIGYLIFEWPQNWAMQRFPIGKWITFNIFLWCIFLGLHPLCKSYGALFVLRFFLGASEGCMTAGLMLICAMYYTRTEIGERLGWTFQCNGLAVIVSSFLSFGAYHADPLGKPNQWQWLFIACTILTFLNLVLFYFFFPDNPMTAYFLNDDEKMRVVQRVRANQNGMETKVWKKHQFIEAITDVKTWLFFGFAATSSLLGGVGSQYAIVIQSFGFTTLQTTLLSIPSGFAQIIGITTGCYMLRLWPNSRAWIGIFWWTPAIICALIQIFLPFSNKIGHLVGLYLLYMGSSTCIIMVMSWVTSAVSGHTKKTTVSAIFFVGYALSQILCTQFWKQQYKPRNIVPWSIILGSHIVSILFMLAIRYVLSTENKRRDALLAEAEASGKGLERFENFAYLETTDEKGNVTKTKVDKAFLDMTDKENLAFRYVL